MGHKQLIVEDVTKDYPDYLKNASKRIRLDLSANEPQIFSPLDSESRFKQFIKSHPEIEVVDNYAEQYAELLLSKHAHLYRANYDVQVASISGMLKKHYKDNPGWLMGTWVYFPWKNQVVHVLAQEDFENLRTIRNRELVTLSEQKALLNFNVSSFGMSVGSAGALSLAVSGISRQIKLIDGAVISGSNLNRILTGVSSVGKSKALVVGQQIYEMNPYGTVNYYDRVCKNNVADIFDKNWNIDMAVDEIDDMAMKVLIRSEARKRGVPVIMATELGDTIMLDVERFDLEPDRPLFHGHIPGIEKLLDSPVENYREWTKHAVSIIDAKNMPLKMQKSLLKIGSTIVTHPQLGSTVVITGGVIAFAAKHIATGGELRSGRYVISLEKELLADHKSRTYQIEHKRHTKLLKKTISSM